MRYFGLGLNNATRYFGLGLNNATRYFVSHMIESFKDANAQELFETGRSRRIPSDIQRIALRKLKIPKQRGGLEGLACASGKPS